MQKLVKRHELWRNCWEHLDRLSFGEHLVAARAAHLEGRAVVVVFAKADVPVETEVVAEQDDDAALGTRSPHAQRSLALRLVCGRQPPKPVAQWSIHFL